MNKNDSTFNKYANSFLQPAKAVPRVWVMLVDCSQALPAWAGAQRLHGNQVVSAATYIVGGVQVTASIDEELNQGGEVVPHGKVHW